MGSTIIPYTIGDDFAMSKVDLNAECMCLSPTPPSPSLHLPSPAHGHVVVRNPLAPCSSRRIMCTGMAACGASAGAGERSARDEGRDAAIARKAITQKTAPFLPHSRETQNLLNEARRTPRSPPAFPTALDIRSTTQYPSRFLHRVITLFKQPNVRREQRVEYCHGDTALAECLACGALACPSAYTPTPVPRVAHSS